VRTGYLILRNEMPEESIFERQARLPSGDSEPHPVPLDFVRAANDPNLTEDLALALLKQMDLKPEVFEALAHNVNAIATKSRTVKIALASHPQAPRHVSIPLARHFYTFDLMKVALSPSVPADLKATIDNIMISRLKTLTLGERITLARRATGRVAAALLLDVERGEGKTGLGKVNRKGDGGKKVAIDKKKDAASANLQHRVMLTALENPRLTEALVITSVLHPQAGPALVDAVARHEKWPRRREIQAALLRTEYLSLAKALEFAQEVPAPLLVELLATSRLPHRIKAQLLRESQRNGPKKEKCE
jgi:hypothetical protein